MTSVSACLVTRGDVDMTPILDSLTAAGINDIVVYDNGARKITIQQRSYPIPTSHRVEIEEFFSGERPPDLAVYGRYAAIEWAKHDLIYVQDDDVIVSDPEAIVREWEDCVMTLAPVEHQGANFIVCNMPPEFRAQPFYKEHALVGFGAVFHRDAPKRAFNRWYGTKLQGKGEGKNGEWGLFRRRCDVVFTALTPRVLVDIPIRNLPHYDAPNRSWKQKDHFKERKKMLELALAVRDA